MRTAHPLLTPFTLLAACALAPACILDGDEPDVAVQETGLVLDSGARLWTDNHGEVPVCFITPGYTRYKDWIQNDVRRTWGRVAALNFTGWGDCPTSNTKSYVRIEFIEATCPTCNNGADGQASGYGMATLRQPGEGSSVRFWVRTPDGSAARSRIAYLAVHEFGHVLGFRHEQDSQENVVTAVGYCSAGAPQTNVTQVSPYDPNSVMNYCNAYGNNYGTLTAGDIAGVRSLYGAREFDLYGRADLVWKNTQTRQFSLWQMSWTAMVQHYVDLGWLATGQEIEGIGDFNGDGNGDLVIRSQSTGAVSIWTLKGNRFYRFENNMSSIPPSWRLAGTGDFDGDGLSDLLWHDSASGDVQVWQMDDSNRVRRVQTIGAGIPGDWIIFGTGDFDGDGRSDILWQNRTNGDVGIWQIGETPGNPPAVFVASYATPARGIPIMWMIEGVGDFDHDGRADIVWRNSWTGEIGIWLMASPSVVREFAVPNTPVPLEWSIETVGDYDTDGHADLAWRNRNTGDVGIWLMDGGRVKSYVSPNNGVPAEWQIVGSLLDPNF